MRTFSPQEAVGAGWTLTLPLGRVFLGLVAASCFLLVPSCSGVDSRPAAVDVPIADPEPGGNPDGDAGPIEPLPRGCTEGVVRECKVFYSVNGTVRSCFVGVELCAEGAWGQCVDSETLFGDDAGAPLSGE